MGSAGNVHADKLATKAREISTPSDTRKQTSLIKCKILRAASCFLQNLDFILDPEQEKNTLSIGPFNSDDVVTDACQEDPSASSDI